MATRIQVTIDCADPNRLARFWAEALGYRLQEPPDGFDSWQAYWVSRGLPPEEVEDGYDAIVDPDGVGPRIWFQPVPEGKVVKNRLHLDLDVGGGRGARWPPAGSGSTPRPTGWSPPARPASGCCPRRPSTTTRWSCRTPRATSSASTETCRPFAYPRL